MSHPASLALICPHPHRILARPWWPPPPLVLSGPRYSSSSCLDLRKKSLSPGWLESAGPLGAASSPWEVASILHEIALPLFSRRLRLPVCRLGPWVCRDPCLLISLLKGSLLPVMMPASEPVERISSFLRRPKILMRLLFAAHWLPLRQPAHVGRAHQH